MRSCILAPHRVGSMTLAKLYHLRMFPRSIPPVRHIHRHRRSRTLAFEADHGHSISNGMHTRPIARPNHKVIKFTPTKRLTVALRNAGFPTAAAVGTPPTLAQERTQQSRKEGSPVRRVSFEARDKYPMLQNILSRFIQRNAGKLPLHAGDDPGPCIAQARLLGKHVALLESRGYTIDDLVFWASLLTTEKIDISAKMLIEDDVVSQQNSRSQKPVPNFLLMHLLGRQLTPSALRDFIAYIWRQLHRKENIIQSKSFDSTKRVTSSKDANDIPVMDDAIVFSLISRLCRQARKLWPQSLPTIVAMFIFNVKLNSKLCTAGRAAEGVGDPIIRTIEAQCNRILSILADPSPLSPFHTVEFLERAQFDLLRCMSEYTPPLAITREGYRAIISVQLRHKKNEEERDWANLKAKSWPPWKEDKTGFDAEKDADYGASRALKVLWGMRDAGYGSQLWERISEIYTGRDVDQSPTIQTRALFKHKSALARTKLTDTNHEMVWAARIRTTRTLQEAWACLLEYKEKNGQLSEHVYFAMLEKVASDEKQSKTRVTNKHATTEGDPLLPGDMKDTIPAPISPKEETYVPVDPPSLHSLAQEMHDRETILSERCICLLLESTRSLENGLTYIGWAEERTPALKALRSSKATAEDLRLIPQRMFNAYITLLCNFPNRESPAPRQVGQGSLVKYTADPVFPNVIAAVRLLQTLLPQYRPSWHTALGAIVDRTKAFSSARLRKEAASDEIIDRFFLAQRLQRQMDINGLPPDLETFRLVARGLENGVRSAKEVLHVDVADNKDQQTTRQQPLAAADRILEQGIYINHLFYDIVGSSATSVDTSLEETESTNAEFAIPSVLAYPYPAYLHQFVRVLGCLHSWKRLDEFVKWMVLHQKDVVAASGMPRNGRRLLRRTIVAVRVFAEASWVQYERNEYGESVPFLVRKDQHQGALTEELAPEPMLAAMENAIESVEAFGGWATDSEVIDYCIQGGFVNSRFT